MTVVAITGHRPEMLGDKSWVEEQLIDVFKIVSPTLVYQGMAAGADLLSAEVAHKLNIPYIACRPWATHEPRVEDVALYEWVLLNANTVVNVNETTTFDGPWLYHNRNHYMVDNSEIVVAVYNGLGKGGTAACVNYAHSKGKQVIVINPDTRTVDFGEPVITLF